MIVVAFAAILARETAIESVKGIAVALKPKAAAWAFILIAGIVSRFFFPLWFMFVAITLSGGIVDARWLLLASLCIYERLLQLFVESCFGFNDRVLF